MARSTTITATAGPVAKDIQIIDGEKLRVTIMNSGPRLVLTVSTTPGGEPIERYLDTDSETTDTFTIYNEILPKLEEGRDYYFNVWDVTDINDQIQVAFGKIRFTVSIKPGIGHNNPPSEGSFDGDSPTFDSNSPTFDAE